jgi:hypothetical protein
LLIYFVKPARPPREEVIKKFATDVELFFTTITLYHRLTNYASYGFLKEIEGAHICTIYAPGGFDGIHRPV